MDFTKTNVYLITDEKQRLYCTGFHSTAGHVIITKTQTYFVVDNRYSYAAKRALEPKGIKVCVGADYTFLKGLIEGEETIGVDFTLTTVKQMEGIKALGVTPVDISSEMETVMAVKSDSELAFIKKACAIAEKSFKQTLPFIKEGVTEREVAARLEFNFKMNGAQDKSFDTIIAFGANTAVPHHATGETKLKKNMPVLMDFGCVYKGYCSDMTRTFYYGTPDKEFKKAYEAVLNAHISTYEGARAGMSGVEVDGIARNALKDAGYGEYFTHSLGHGIGVNIHEYPWVSPKGENKLENGMVFSIEPGVYLNGKFGIRIEDTVVMAEGKPRTFMKHPKCLYKLIDGKLKK